jgi:hypothetical protein
MGKVAKIAVPVALFAGVGWATSGFGLIGGAAGAGGTMTTAGMSAVGGETLTAAGFAATGGMSSSVGFGAATSNWWNISSFIPTPTWRDAASIGFVGLSMASSLAAGEDARNIALAAAQREELRLRAVRLQALQLEAGVLKRGELSRSAAYAQVVANGMDTRSPSFAAFVEDQESEVQTQVGNIRVNAELGAISSTAAIRQFRQTAGIERASGVISAGRSLFQAASRRA